MKDYHAMGYERGKAAGSWVVDGNTSPTTARKILAGYEEGDPEIMDLCPNPLSGEWAGESLSQLDLDDASAEDLEEYEIGFMDGFWTEVVVSAECLAWEGR